MNDSTPLAPADASAPEHSSAPNLANDAGPSLAPSGGHEPLDHTQSAAAGRVGSAPAFHNASAPAMPAPSATIAPLEERLRRLEESLAQIADPKQIESRIAQRVSERLAGERPIPVAQIAPALSQGLNVTLPAGLMLDMGKRILTSTAGANRPAGQTEHAESALSSGVRRTILFFDMLTEARAIWCMFTDPRYRMSWAGRLVPLALALFLLTSAFLVPGAQIPIFGTIIDKLIDLVPAFILFKLLSYEARRYRETAPDLPPDLRL
jgi:hypothetical protein